MRFINPPFTATTLWKWIKKGDAVPDYRLYHSWRPLKEISPHIRRAVLAGEDQRFLSHHGFDFTEMNEEYAKHFDSSTPPPARAAVEVARLPKDVKIQIEAIAVIL